jgi:CBS domain-containing protein
MTRDVICCTPTDSVAEVMGMMTARRFRHLPVKSNGKLIGMVSIGDVVKARVEEAEGEAAQLREYIAS